LPLCHLELQRGRDQIGEAAWIAHLAEEVSQLARDVW
jgi:hypothetical protein